MTLKHKACSTDEQAVNDIYPESAGLPSHERNTFETWIDSMSLF